MAASGLLGDTPFAFFAGMAESERENIREKSLEGQASARDRDCRGGRPRAGRHRPWGMTLPKRRRA
ncbi:hypothetical protein AB0N31_32915 [Streptomyces sp. NPDC051051]|uniref:hypothetical protein n=1 Tax=Streptomyces sp. NPDC051051 TaxID=3155666 RepID=UPI003442041A